MPLRFVLVLVLLVAAAIDFRGLRHARVVRPSVREAVSETARELTRHVRAAGAAHNVALLAIFGIGVALRVDFLTGPMRWDESYTFTAYASRPLEFGLGLYDYPNNHVFHTLLVHVSCSVLSDLATCGPAAIRAPVFAAGVALPVVAYVGVAQLYGRHAALVVAALAATSPQLVEYSTNARGYEIAALAAVALVALTPRLLRSTNATYWVVFVLVGALGFYTVPVFGYPFAVVFLALVLAAVLGTVAVRGLRFLVWLAGALGATVALTALLYGPILDDIVRMYRTSAFSHDAQSILSHVLQTRDPGTVAVLIGALPVSVAVAVVARRHRRGESVAPDAAPGRRLAVFGVLGAAVAFVAASLARMVDDVFALVGQRASSYEGTPVLEQVWSVWTLGLPQAGRVLLVVGFALSAVVVGRRRGGALPLATAFAVVGIAAVVEHRVIAYVRGFVPLLPLFLICAAAGLLGWRRTRNLLERRAVDTAFSAVALAIAVSLGATVSRDRLADADGSMLPAAEPIAEVLAPRLTADDRVLVTVAGWSMQVYAFTRHGLPTELIVLRMTPPVPHSGRTYLVVNEFARETVASAIRQTAPGSRLGPKRRIARFEGATLYELAPRPRRARRANA